MSSQVSVNKVNTLVTEARLPFWRKLLYGLGDFGSNYCWTFIASFMLIYFTNTLNISAGVVGTLMMFSKILDGITDVFMGVVIDKTKSKMGKARFWVFWSSFPVGITTFMLFNVPAGFSDTAKYIYIFIVYTLMGAIFYTMSNIAYSSLTALVTKNQEDRVALGSFRFIFAILAGLTIQSTTMGLVEKFGTGQKGWTMVSLFYAVICIIGLLMPFFGVKELPSEELNEVKGKKESQQNKMSMGKAFMYLIKNKYFLLILVYYLVTYGINGISTGLGIYFATYNLNNAALLGVLSMSAMIPYLVILPLLPKITSKFGMRNTCLIGSIISLVGAVLRIFYGGNVTILLIAGVISGIGGAPMIGAMNAFIAAAADYSVLKHSVNLTGTIYSCSSVGIKVGTGLGTAIAGWALTLSGFNGAAKVQSAQTINAIGNLYILPGIVSAAAIVFIIFAMNVEKTNAKLREEVK